jgi:murein DD-endopeptidase MepM/ murein hydrolase activator NlpD
VNTPYGIQRRYNGVLFPGYFHEGVDIAAECGAPVYAPGDGQIVILGTVRQGFSNWGNTVAIDHGELRG